MQFPRGGAIQHSVMYTTFPVNFYLAAGRVHYTTFVVALDNLNYLNYLRISKENGISSIITSV